MLARRRKRQDVSPASTGGRLVYAVGDIHGRLDLLQAVLSLIEADLAASPPRETPALVFVGDYVDRGPASRAVVDRIVQLQRAGAFEVTSLMGNHERTLLDFLDDAAVGPIWALHGGKETLLDYGVTPPAEGEGEAWIAARDAFERALPRRHRDFFTALTLQATVGDYFFVHAGVRPGVPLAEQAERDLLTIRRDFLAADAPYGKVVVHGHTPVEEASLGQHRINLDTGAYATGLLTAVRLEGTERRFLQAKAATPAPYRRPKLADFRARWVPEAEG